MKIATTYDNGNIFAHFGHCIHFKLYIVENGEVVSTRIITSMKGGHGALSILLAEHKVDKLICGGIGNGAKEALSAANIEVFPGVSGDANESVQALLEGTLVFDRDTTCNHHHEDGHDCGENKHNCTGN